MRSVSVRWRDGFLIAVLACSSDPAATRMQEPLQPSAGAAGSAGSATSNAGQGGAAGSLGAALGGASSEGQGPLDLAGASGSGDAGAAGSSPAAMGGADAGVPGVGAGACPPGPFADDPLAGAAEPALVCDGMSFTEGPVWFQERGTLYFSDFSIDNPGSNFDGLIWTHVPGQGCEEFIPGAGTNGLAIAPDGNLLSCRHLDRTLTIFDLESRQPRVFIEDNQGARFNSPNDVVVRSDGNIYFTDPTFLLAGRPSDQPGGPPPPTVSSASSISRATRTASRSRRTRTACT